MLWYQIHETKGECVWMLLLVVVCACVGFRTLHNHKFPIQRALTFFFYFCYFVRKSQRQRERGLITKLWEHNDVYKFQWLIFTWKKTKALECLLCELGYRWEGDCDDDGKMMALWNTYTISHFVITTSEQNRVYTNTHTLADLLPAIESTFRTPEPVSVSFSAVDGVCVCVCVCVFACLAAVNEEE